MHLPATITSEPIPDGNCYSFDEVTPLLGGFVAYHLKRFPRFAEDINQAALLGAWEITGRGPRPLGEVAAAVKKRVAESLGEVIDRHRDARDVNWQSEGPPAAEPTPVAAKRLVEFDALPGNEKELLRRVFRDGFAVNDAADELRVGRAQALRLYRRYKPLLADARPDEAVVDWRREYYNDSESAD